MFFILLGMKNVTLTFPIYKSTGNSLKQIRKSYHLVCDNSKQNSEEITSSSSLAIRNNSIPFISFKGVTKPNTIEEIVSTLDKEYGIKADFSSLETAKLTLETVEDFVKLNDKDIFKGLVINQSSDTEEGSFYRYHSDYNDKSFVLSLNNNKSIEKLQQETINDFENCKIGSPNKKYYLYEVLGHFLNFKYNPYSFTVNGNCNNFSDLASTIALKIGANAHDSISRYNASYIATKMCGESLPPKAKEIYEDSVGADINFPEEKTQKLDFGIIHNFGTVEEASEYLKQYGIDADFENIIVANLAVGAIEDFINVNNNKRMFEGLKIGRYVCSDSNVLGSVHNVYNYDTDKIKLSELNFNSSYDWKRHDKHCKYNYETGHYASNHPKYSIYHELGHWLHFQKMPREYSQLNDKFKYHQVFINDYGKITYGKVSGYAQTTTIEYVAETIAAKMCGLNFPKRTMEEFDKFNETLNLKFPN